MSIEYRCSLTQGILALVELPLNVQRKIEALGREGHAWADALPALIADLEREWDIEVSAPMDGGSAAYVAPATMADGTEAVIKLAMPDGLEGNGRFARELWAIQLGQGGGYVDLLRSDAERRVMLQERLGSPLSEGGFSVDDQLAITADLLARSWQPAAEPAESWDEAKQADFLHDFIGRLWEETGRPCSADVIERAQSLARARRDGFEAENAVVIHGDAHPVNVLQSGDGYKLIDPDAMLSSPAHDLGILLREWNDEVLADPPLVGKWCAQLAGRTGAPADDIWQWAFIERVSTGLFILSFGDPSGGAFLQTAELLARE